MRKLLILGGSGMLGNTLLRRLSTNSDYSVHGTIRSATAGPVPRGATIHSGVDVRDGAKLKAVIASVRPDVVINCVGLIKQRAVAQDPQQAISMNALFPHQLAERCTAIGARLVHFSTDCVFSGSRGNYREDDPPDANDLYGRSKLLGEVDYGGHLTLRTSIIGHELANHHSLIDWFLARTGPVSGYAGVFFSGLPAVEIARIMDRLVLPDDSLSGLYHLSSEAIDKDRLLRLVAAAYGYDVEITSCQEPRLNRVLDSGRLRKRLNYDPPAWEDLIADMHRDFVEHYAPLRRTGANEA